MTSDEEALYELAKRAFEDPESVDDEEIEELQQYASKFGLMEPRQ